MVRTTEQLFACHGRNVRCLLFVQWDNKRYKKNADLFESRLVLLDNKRHPRLRNVSSHSIVESE